MKQKVLLIVAMLLAMTTSMKGEELSVADVQLPMDGNLAIPIELLNPNVVYDSYSFKLELPDGVVPVMGGDGYPSFTLGSRYTGSTFSGYDAGNNVASFARLTDGTTITGTSGMLIAPIVKVDGVIAGGTVLTARLTNIKFTKTNLTKDVLDDVVFHITVGEAPAATVLDENSTVAPVAATGVNVHVARTLKANEWSTICLPFAMSAAQVSSAFGADAQLVNFTGYSVGRDGTNAITSIKVNFASASEIEANRPCLIKVRHLVETFDVDGVDIDPAANPTVEYNDGVSVLGTFTGTYVAETTVPNKSLFLSNNKFWYSKGLTKMMAYRAYFTFNDVLADVDGASARIAIAIDDETITSIDHSSLTIDHSAGAWYTLDGRKMNKKPTAKGLYMNGNKKVLVK